ncbi:MAG TPA: c-type cytochrome [Pyrinomonadaceae bacterium]|nr:c-type cytochrome [Pyrinomonadaceae bacterium]
MIFRKRSREKDAAVTTPTPPGHENAVKRSAWRNVFSRDSLLLYSFGGVVLLITALVFWAYYTPEWSDYQDQFQALVAKKYGADRAAQAPRGLQQIWVKELNRVDRCITCHQGIEWKGLDSAPNPFKSHPQEILKKHPLNQFGCTACHGGQGYATDMESAHGFTEHWEEPLLGKQVSDLYLVKDRKAMMQMNCNSCHRYDRQTTGADYINQAKQLLQAKNCRACHTINGRGGVIGPDLTFVGDKSPEQYDYSRMLGVKTAFAWHVAHLQNPKALVPETVMPNFNFNSKDAQALALLVMSWKRVDVPASYRPGFKLAETQTPEEAEREKQMLTGEGSFFVKKGCFACHSVTAFDIKSASDIGPDLSFAVSDVQSRFGKTLEDFLANPTGTMAVVLSTQIQLTDEERQEAVAKLKSAYEKKLSAQAQAADQALKNATAKPSPSPKK